MKILNWVLVVAVALLINVGIVKGEGQMVEAGKKVKIDYTLYVRGEVVDTSEGREPLEYTQGEGMIIKGLESQLEGLKVGDEKTVIVAPEDGYGAVEPSAIMDLPKTSLAEGVVPEKGMMLQLQGKEGQIIPGIVEEVGEETVKVNFNHPLAGQELKFQVKIVGVE